MSSHRRKGKGGGGGHGGSWVVTFADLVSLLMAFFVMIVSFSVPNTEAVNRISGSMRDAFGVQPTPQQAGMIEREGLPLRLAPRSVGLVQPDVEVEFETDRDATAEQHGPEANTHDFDEASSERPRQFLSAAETLRQALADMPDIAEISKSIVFAETEAGLHMRIVDQNGRAMFMENSALPNPDLRRILERLAPVLQQMPNRVRISGHTSSDVDPARMDSWRLSTQRAVAAAELLAGAGLRTDRLEAVTGRSSDDPLIPSDPLLSANRRIEITLLREAPPLPVSLVR